MENEIKIRKIKTAGLINGVWAVVLDDDSILDGVTNITMVKNGTEIGQMNLNIKLP